jgi:hypothetical protein
MRVLEGQASVDGRADSERADRRFLQRAPRGERRRLAEPRGERRGNDRLGDLPPQGRPARRGARVVVRDVTARALGRRGAGPRAPHRGARRRRGSEPQPRRASPERRRGRRRDDDPRGPRGGRGGPRRRGTGGGSARSRDAGGEARDAGQRAARPPRVVAPDRVQQPRPARQCAARVLDVGATFCVRRAPDRAARGELAAPSRPAHRRRAGPGRLGEVRALGRRPSGRREGLLRGCLARALAKGARRLAAPGVSGGRWGLVRGAVGVARRAAAFRTVARNEGCGSARRGSELPTGNDCGAGRIVRDGLRERAPQRAPGSPRDRVALLHGRHRGHRARLRRLRGEAPMLCSRKGGERGSILQLGQARERPAAGQLRRLGGRRRILSVRRQAAADGGRVGIRGPWDRRAHLPLGRGGSALRRVLEPRVERRGLSGGKQRGRPHAAGDCRPRRWRVGVDGEAQHGGG